MNIDILGISELKWTGIGEFNSDDHYIYYCGQESLRRNGVAIIVNKKVQYCKKHYCVAIWNVKSMNQGKLEVVKQEMTRVNIDILEIRKKKKKKRKGRGKFN